VKPPLPTPNTVEAAYLAAILEELRAIRALLTPKPEPRVVKKG
jgi:hypothetical protein